MILVLSGCTKAGSQEIENAWSAFYAFDSTQDSFWIPISEFQATDTPDELISVIAKEWRNKGNQFSALYDTMKPSESFFQNEEKSNFKKGINFLKQYRDDALSEVKEIDSVKVVGCPNSFSESKLEIIKRCGRINFAWSDAESVSLMCTLVKANNAFAQISGFNPNKSKSLQNVSEEKKKACEAFDTSHRIHGHPKTIGETWVPSRFNSDFDSNANRTLTEVADGLWASKMGDNSSLESALYASWFGYCGPYRKYEKKLSEAGLLLGSIKSGSCRN